jgi:hypothetical protein
MDLFASVERVKGKVQEEAFASREAEKPQATPTQVAPRRNVIRSNYVNR